MRVAEPPAPRPDWAGQLELRVTMGPHCTDEFLTGDDIRAFLEAEWTVHYHSDRTGVRLIGPRPAWSRSDGGDAGLHPSNIHGQRLRLRRDRFYRRHARCAGPGRAEPGRLRMPGRGDRSGSLETRPARRRRQAALAGCYGDRSASAASPSERGHRGAHARANQPVAAKHHIERSIVLEHEDVRVRRAGDEALLVEFGPNTLDLELRLRVHAFQAAIEDDTLTAWWRRPQASARC